MPAYDMGTPWRPMETHADPRGPVGANGGQWELMGTHGYPFLVGHDLGSPIQAPESPEPGSSALMTPGAKIQARLNRRTGVIGLYRLREHVF